MAETRDWPEHFVLGGRGWYWRICKSCGVQYGGNNKRPGCKSCFGERGEVNET